MDCEFHFEMEITHEEFYAKLTSAKSKCFE
jgi:hypothetical protein